jgi:hypothetical protein
VPLNNEQEVDSEHPQDEINEPQPVRRTLCERKGVIYNDYIVYISEDVENMDDLASYK